MDAASESRPSLNWRLDPSESYSDWEIETVFQGKRQTYHVHKAVLAFGPRGSQYFARLFESGSFRESETQRSTIELDDEAMITAFPTMLDAMYNIKDPIQFDTSNVFTLHNLGIYFGIPQLREEARKFWKRADRQSAPTLLAMALAYGDETALDDLAKFFAKHDIKHYLQTVPRTLDHWVRMAKAIAVYNTSDKQSRKVTHLMKRTDIWSLQLADLFESIEKPFPFDRKALEQLAYPTVLPRADDRAVIRLLYWEFSTRDDPHANPFFTECLVQRCGGNRLFPKTPVESDLCALMNGSMVVRKKRRVE